MLRLVVLNVYEGARGSQRDIFSSTAATLALRGMPAVLAMQEAITDRAAFEFARTFYRAIAAGMPVDAALAEGRLAISMEFRKTLEWGTPILYLRSADSLLFDFAERTPPAQQKIGAHALPPPRLTVTGTAAPPSGSVDQDKFEQVGTAEPEQDGAGGLHPGRDNRAMIDLGIEAARKLGAEHHAVSLSELHAV